MDWKSIVGAVAPTAGGILGGIGGALVPGLGETGISEAAGSAAGSAGGQQLANWLTGSKESTAKAGIEGGIGAGVGSVLGRVGGALGRGVLGKVADATAPKVAAEAAPVEGAAQAAYDKPFVDALGDTTSAMRMQKQGIQYQPVRDFMQNQMGASNDPAEWSKIANFIAGDPGTAESPTTGAWLSKQVTNAAANQPDLLKDEIIPQLHGLLQEHGSSVVEPAATDTLGKFVSLGLGKAQRVSPTGQETYSAEGLQNLVKQIGNRYANNPLTLNPLAQTTEAKMTEHEALPAVKQFLSDLVNNRGGVDEAIAKDTTSPEVAAKIMSEAPTPQAGQYVIDNLTNGKSAAELNAAARPAVQADRIAKEVMDFQKGIKPVVQQGKDVASAQGEADKLATAEANQPHPAEKATAGIVNALGGGAMGKLKALAQAGGGFVPTLNKLATAGAESGALSNPVANKVGAGLGGGIGGTLGLIGQPQPGGSDAGLASSTQPPQQEGAQGTGAEMSPLQQAFLGNEGAAGQFQRMAEQVPANLNSSLVGGATGMAQAGAGLAPQAQAQQQAGTILGGIPGQYNQAPTGLMGALEGMIPGTAGYAYNQQQQAAAASIAKLLGISPQQAAGLLPQLLTPQATPLREQTLGGLLGNLGG